MALVAHYKLNEPTGTSGANSIVDSSGNSHHGTPAAAVVGAGGKRQSAIVFDGTADYIAISDSAAFILSATLSLTCWAKNDNSGLSVFEALLAKEDRTPESEDLEWRFSINSDEKLEFTFWSDNATTQTVIRSDAAIDIDEWHHYAVTKSGTTLVLYVDGKVVASTITNNNGHDGETIRNGAADIRIGDWEWAGTVRTWEGVIDDARIYDEALSAGQIRGIASEGGYRARYMAGFVGDIVKWFRTRY